VNFNADAYLDAMERPSFTIGGRTHQGRILSFDEWLEFEPRMRAAVAGELGPNDLRLLVYQFVRRLFPKPWWRFWSRSVAWHLLSLPLEAQMKAVESFIRSQVRAMGLRAQTPAKSTSGSS
jgi:hypothetical protein